ncbi:lysophosphatidic acid receptor 1-A-like [Mytilus trossulus]|uniref:lysophosphatidic acid receptor 1-A-like n=1 Tax=Mytilus trossulus TaxID=6551 RepID=UPI003003ED86
MAACNISSTDVNFLHTNISNLQTVIRWMKFCQIVYKDHCDLDLLEPTLTNIPTLKTEATHSDCFNTKQLASYCICLLLSASILVANSLIIAAFITSRKLLTSSNLPILSLACSDLLTGLAFIYPTSWGLIILVTGYDFDIFKVLEYVTKRQNYYLCLLLDGPGLLFACMMSSVLSLGIIAGERYIAVFHSYRYPYWITTTRMVLAIVILWIISLIVAILPLFGWNNWTGSCQLLNMMHSGYLIFWTIICFICGFLILFVYIRIFCLARKHRRQIEAAQVTNTSMSSLHTSTTSSYERRKSRKSATKTDTSSSMIEGRQSETNENQTVTIVKTISGNNAALHRSDTEESDKTEVFKSEIGDKPDTTESKYTTKERQQQPRFLKKSQSKSIFNNINMKAIRTTSMILGAFYICWSPFLIYMLVYHSNTDTSYNITAYYLAIVTQLNSLFNPILYGFRHLEIKQAIRKMFKCKRCCSNQPNF